MNNIKQIKVEIEKSDIIVNNVTKPKDRKDQSLWDASGRKNKKKEAKKKRTDDLEEQRQEMEYIGKKSSSRPETVNNKEKLYRKDETWPQFNHLKGRKALTPTDKKYNIK